MDVITPPRTIASRDRRPPRGPLRVVAGPSALRRWAVVSLVMNIVIVVTGALVRLTASGLGCPTWPRCSDDSYVTHPELGIHGLIEFGNRMLTFVLIIAAVLTFVSALLYRENGRGRRDLRWLAGGLLFGIPFQGVIGGITVLTQLNPYVVALHLILSMVLISLSVWLVRRTRHLQPRPVTTRWALATRATFVSMWLAVWLGTIVTGSGPHAGDANAPRTGLVVEPVAHVHSAFVYAAIALTVLCVIGLRSRAALLLLTVEVVQAAIGLTQYHLGLPVPLVALHLLGASLAIAATTNLMLSTKSRAPLTVTSAVRAG